MSAAASEDDLYALRNELQALRDELNLFKQNGLDTLLMQRAFTFAAQRERLDKTGIQILADAGSAPPDLNLIRYLRVVDRLDADPNSRLTAAGGSAFGSTVTSSIWNHVIQTENTGSTKTASHRNDIDADSTESSLNAGITNSASVKAYVDGTLTDGIVQVSPGLELVGRTSDITAPNDGTLEYRTDTDKAKLRANGAWVNLLTSGDSIGTLLQRTVNTALASSSSESDRFTYSVPANTLGSAGLHALRFFASGYYLNNTAGTSDLTIRFYYGTGSAMGDTITLPQSASFRAWWCYGELTNNSSTNAQKLGIRFEMSAAASSAINAIGTWNTAPSFHGSIRGTYSADSTSAQNFKMSAQHSVNDANVQFGLDQAMLEVV